MANRGALGGLSEAALQAALLMDAAGKDDVFLETVGVGQAEVDIIDHADTVVLVLQPGSGDSIQALKAGVMEIPDVIVVNKADHPLTDTMVREIRGVLSLGPQEGWVPPIVTAEAARGERRRGDRGQARRAPCPHRGEGTLAERRRRNLRDEVLALATGRMRRRLEADVDEDPAVRRPARRGRRPPARPGQRGHRAARTRTGELMDERIESGMRIQLAGWRSAMGLADVERVGWKVGLNAPPVMEALGIDRPVIGWLASGTTLAAPAEFVTAGTTKSGAEPELAITVGEGGSVAGLAPAIEVVDVDKSFDDLAAILADNIFHRGVVFGPQSEPRALPGITARVECDGETEAELELADAVGDPAEVVRARGRPAGGDG